ncbi:MAG: type II toxin-antitoxin system Phd/YefM family antitoxin [Cardiobacteriaceae bacterium]|nr:type II toxin-antitoxin system Phd/YefM family antitoxin [Cardiobacteriaceae bacterium]
MTTITNSEFQQDSRKAQKAAETAPVFITKRGKPAQVLMSYADYQKLADKRPSAADTLRALPHPDVADIELDIPPRSKAQRRPVEF